MANEVFISYSRKDYDKVRQIKNEIDREVGINCWMDLDGIEGGDVIHRNITSAINRHDTILFMQSTNSMRGDWTLKELGYAEAKGKRIILVNIDGSQMTDDFLFAYNTKNNILWSNSLQRNQLVRNLKTWRKSNSRTSQSISDVKKKYSYPNSVFLCLLTVCSFLISLYLTIRYNGRGPWYYYSMGYFMAGAILYLDISQVDRKNGDKDGHDGAILIANSFVGLFLGFPIGGYYSSFWIGLLIFIVTSILGFCIAKYGDD